MSDDSTELLAPEIQATPDETVSSEPSAKMFDSDTVQKIVQRERLKAYEKAKREVAMEQPQGTPSLGGMQQLTEQQIRDMIAKEMPSHLEQHIHRATNERMVDTFVGKVRAAEQKYPGLEDSLNKFDYTRGDGMTDIIFAANQLENTADVMKEVIDNPSKLATLLTLSRQPYALQQAMNKISDSIKQNQAAPEREETAVTQKLKASPTAAIDGGNMSVTDYRKMFR